MITLGWFCPALLVTRSILKPVDWDLSRGEWIGLGVTLVGLGIAIWQVVKTRSATEATQRSVDATLGRLARDEILRLIGDLQRADRDLQAAIHERQSPALVGDRLADWRDKAYGLWELIHRDSKIDIELHDDLLESAKLAAELRGDLPDTAGEVPGAAKATRASISRVCGQLATLSQQVRYDTARED